MYCFRIHWLLAISLLIHLAIEADTKYVGQNVLSHGVSSDEKGISSIDVGSSSRSQHKALPVSWLGQQTGDSELENPSSANKLWRQSQSRPTTKRLAAYSGMEATLSDAGLNYAKDVLVGKVLDEITPLGVPNISLQTVTSFGTVTVDLTRINLTCITVVDAAIALGEDGITIFAQGVEANATLHWKYTYAGLLGDSGTADVKVEGLQAGISFNLTAVNGTLRMAVLESGVVIEHLSIVLHNSYSWVYNWLVSSFTNHLRAAIESAVNAGIVRASLKLDSYLQGLPRQIPVDSIAAIDATITEDPIVAVDRLSFGPRGEFVNIADTIRSSQAPPPIPDGVLCGDSQKMVTIAMTDFVVNSAARVYFEAGKLTYLVDQLPEASPFRLNTASWRFILPALYNKYPNQDMVLEFITSSAPAVTFTDRGVRANWTADMLIAVVQEGGDPLGVACLSLALAMEGWAGINGNNLTGTFQLSDLSLGLKWSDIGTFPVRTLQAVTRTVVKTVVLPIINRQLATGFPLPVVPGVQVMDAAVVYGDQYLFVCTDIKYTGGLFRQESLLESVGTNEVLRRALKQAGEQMAAREVMERVNLDADLLVNPGERQAR